MKNNTSGACAACARRLLPIAQHLNLNPLAQSLLEHPQRVITVAMSIRMDDGSLRVFSGFRVQYNDALGPTKGGIRYHEHVSRDEVCELAFLMMMKNSLAGLPYGGGKGGITVDPKTLSKKERERLTRAFARALGTTVGPHTDIPAPDVNTDAETMGWFADEYAKIVGKYEPAVVTGKPLSKGGSRGRDIATGLGGVYVLEQYIQGKKWKPEETTIAVQGFGNVGGHIARLLSERGYKVVAVSNSRGGVYREGGFSSKELARAQKERALPLGVVKTNDDILTLPVTVLIPAALSEQIHSKNAPYIKARVVLEMANAPTTVEADHILHARRIDVIPDILANAGGVIVSYFEWVQNLKKQKWSEEKVAAELKKKILAASSGVLARSRRDKCDLRTAAFALAIERVLNAEKKRKRL
jgi:glutamate dehydrogenase/leucine dehydrogenase